MQKRNKIISRLVAVIVLIFATAVFASCSSNEKNQLKKSVNEYSSTLPQNVAPGVTITSVIYEPTTDKVILKCEIENEAVAEATKASSAMLRAAFIPYLKHAKTGNPFITNMIKANATLDCQFTHDGQKVTSFLIEADEIK